MNERVAAPQPQLAAPASSVLSRPILRRACACGGTPGLDGECAACRAKRLQGRSRLSQPVPSSSWAGPENVLVGSTIGPPDDRFEREADRVADAVARPGPAPVRDGQGRTGSPPAPGLTPSPAPAGVDGAAGRPLPDSVRRSFEPRFGHDFGHVRVHTGARAAAAAHALSAAAFTTGHHIYFGRDRFAPETVAGRHLIAHELVHTLQQAAGTASAPRIQRRVLVHDPSGVPAGAPPAETNEKIVDGYVRTLCSDFGAKGGKVEPTSAAKCAAGAVTTTPDSCKCLCDMHALRDPKSGAAIDWTIAVDDNDWPHTDDSTRTVTVHSPFSGVEFGAWTAGKTPHRTVLPNWLVLGHELCGHARLFARGTHPTGPPSTHGGRPSHDPTVQIQNTLATEHGIPASELRGLFADPHHGESIAKVTIAQFPTNSSDVTSLPAAEQRRIDLAEKFIKSAAVQMDVIGHADQVGPSAATNMTVSKDRANSVRAELVRRGIASGRFLVVNGVGSAECPTAGSQPSCRKVDVFMFILEGGSESHP